MIRGILLGVAILVMAAPAVAQGVDEVVVTAARRTSAYGEGAPVQIVLPHIVLKHRADSVIVDLVVRSDTRDRSDRLNEIRQALSGLQGRASAANVALALVDDDQGIILPFTMAAAEELITGDNRPDTSMLTIHLKTPVSASDTLATIHQRIDRFVMQTPKPGRVEMSTGETQLVLSDPEQYREPLLRSVAQDGQLITSAMGQGYGLTMTGLERRVAWQRTGDLELTLFIPYSLSTAPRAQ
ncbi:MAG: hypothetical protein HY054_15155 [Proteobacteria bacterium]|nr:hypothetical protein [Pseudomonadota bacterium]